MATRKKTDNKSLDQKLRLRRYFLNRYHKDATEIRLFETCQGEGHIWRSLEKEYPLRIWGVDVKPQKGRLAVDACRVLASGIGPMDVVDIDTYGEPWTMLSLFLSHGPVDCTVFLTWGMPRISQTSNFTKEVMRLPSSTPSMLASKASWRFAVQESLGGITAKAGVKIIEGRMIQIVQAASRVRYIGLRLAKN